MDPRIPVETLCSEVVDDREHYGMLVELSPNGVRLVAAASRHLRMLRDWVAATVEAKRRAREDDISGMIALASHWRG